jgi:hypothetical protein
MQGVFQVQPASGGVRHLAVTELLPVLQDGRQAIGVEGMCQEGVGRYHRPEVQFLPEGLQRLAHAQVGMVPAEHRSGRAMGISWYGWALNGGQGTFSSAGKSSTRGKYLPAA